MSNNAMTPSFRSPMALSTPLSIPQLIQRRSTISLPSMHGICNVHAIERQFTGGDDHITQLIEQCVPIEADFLAESSCLSALGDQGAKGGSEEAGLFHTPH